MAYSAIITILLLFQQAHDRNVQHVYLDEVLEGKLASAFPQALSYLRFVAFIPRVLLPWCGFLKSLEKNLEDIGLIDSTLIVVCPNKSIPAHRVFAGLAQRGKTTQGGFYGLKLHPQSLLTQLKARGVH